MEPAGARSSVARLAWSVTCRGGTQAGPALSAPSWPTVRPVLLQARQSQAPAPHNSNLRPASQGEVNSRRRPQIESRETSECEVKTCARP